MAPFLAVPSSSASGICILFVQRLDEDVGGGDTVEGAMGRAGMSLGLVPLQQRLSCSSALLGASGSQPFSGCVFQAPASAAFQLDSANGRHWM